MGKIDARVTVVDAGPLIHLDELGCLDLLADFSPLIVPVAVWVEVMLHRTDLRVESLSGCHLDKTKHTLSPRLAVMADSLGLGSGERAALALAISKNINIFLTDDAAARLAGESLGLRVHGTIGILVRSIRSGGRTRAEVLSILRGLPRTSSLHISRGLLDTVIRKVSREP